MPRKPGYPPLNVFINGRLVGRLLRGQVGALGFQYDRTWLDRRDAIPISLSLPLRERRHLGEGVAAIFDNLLPDNADVRRAMAERVGAPGSDAYSLLAAIGRDCVGALQFLPEGVEVGKPGAVAGRRLSDARIAHRLRNLAQAPLGNDDDGDFRISIAGAQEKTALLRIGARWLLPDAATATSHILKPQIGRLKNGIDLSRSVENEHFCLRLADAYGLQSASTEIRDFEDQRVLVVERFDRLWTRDKRLLRLPQEDCCQALAIPPTRKYQSDGGPGIKAILEFLKGSDDAAADRRFFLKAQFMFWLLGATDGHAKNFSIRIAAGGRFRMTPLYDVMSAQPNVDAGQISRNRMKLAMSVGDNRHYVVDRIAPRHFVQTAAAAGLSRDDVEAAFRDILDQGLKPLEATIAGLPGDFPAAIAKSIRKGFESRFKLAGQSLGG